MAQKGNRLTPKKQKNESLQWSRITDTKAISINAIVQNKAPNVSIDLTLRYSVDNRSSSRSSTLSRFAFGVTYNAGIFILFFIILFNSLFLSSVCSGITVLLSNNNYHPTQLLLQLNHQYLMGCPY